MSDELKRQIEEANRITINDESQDVTLKKSGYYDHGPLRVYITYHPESDSSDVAVIASQGVCAIDLEGVKLWFEHRSVTDYAGVVTLNDRGFGHLDGPIPTLLYLVIYTFSRVEDPGPMPLPYQ